MKSLRDVGAENANKCICGHSSLLGPGTAVAFIVKSQRRRAHMIWAQSETMPGCTNANVHVESNGIHLFFGQKTQKSVEISPAKYYVQVRNIWKFQYVFKKGTFD